MPATISIMELSNKAARRKKNWMSAAIPERGLGHIVLQAGRTFGNAMQQRLASHGVTLSQWLHLRALFDNKGMTQSGLSKYLGVEKASSTAILNHLESHQLIRRVTNKEDRRITNLELTEAGIAFVSKVIPNAVEVNGIARKGLTQKEMKTFIYVVRTMIENLQNSGGGSCDPAFASRCRTRRSKVRW